MTGNLSWKLAEFVCAIYSVPCYLKNHFCCLYSGTFGDYLKTSRALMSFYILSLQHCQEYTLEILLNMHGVLLTTMLQTAFFYRILCALWSICCWSADLPDSPVMGSKSILINIDSTKVSQNYGWIVPFICSLVLVCIVTLPRIVKLFYDIGIARFARYALEPIETEKVLLEPYFRISSGHSMVNQPLVFRKVRWKECRLGLLASSLDRKTINIGWVRCIPVHGV